jgi:hypothetical protein
MTEPQTPSAAEALRLAFSVVSSPCSAAEAERARVLLGIARELREEQQYRSIARRKLLAAGIPWAEEQTPPAAPKAISAPDPAQIIINPTPQQRAEWLEGIKAQGAKLADAGATQRLPVIWADGDKADCRHCHTPIAYSSHDATQIDGARVAISGWRHKYTGQVVCVDAPMGQGPEDTVVAHTFAEPQPRG